MSFDLLTKFLLELAPEQAKNPIIRVMDSMKKDPEQTMILGFNSIYDSVKLEGSPESAAAVNGILLGIVLSYGVQNSTAMAERLKEYIERGKKTKGENVIDFSIAKAGLRK